MAKQRAFYLDGNSCTGCKACQVACKDGRDLPVGILWRRVVQHEGGSWAPHPTLPGVMVSSNVFAYSLSISCNHCEDPACLPACPVEALIKRADGVVVIDEEKCIGCRICEPACPYGAVQFDDRTGKASKCDFCADLLDLGHDPVCVDACVMRALQFGELEELRAKHGEISAVEPLPGAATTKPSLVITPHRHARIARESDVGGRDQTRRRVGGAQADACGRVDSAAHP